ncbi:MAG: PASTA domain-containing protein [Acidimicrobiia bacterium]
MTLFIGPPQNPDKYQLLEVRSRGGEGEVWKATTTVDSVEIPVAMKVLLPTNAEDLDSWHQRWLRQAELLNSVSHPNLMTVREVFLGAAAHEEGAAGPETTLCLVMNWVEGESLVQWAERRPDRDALESLRIIGGLAAAVDYLHSGSDVGQTILHRDIKPANVIVTEKGPKLVDFGFVRVQGSTSPMTMVGSPAYIAPEAAAALAYTEASDLYSLGATAYFALTGYPPNIEDVDEMRRRLEVKGLEGRSDVHEHILAMLSRDPARRPASAVDWAQGLATLSIVGGSTVVSERHSTPTPPQSATTPQAERKRQWLVPAMVILAILLTAGALVWALGGPLGDGPPPAEAASDSGSTSTVASLQVMPLLVGMSQEEASSRLAELGVSDVTIEVTPSDGEPGIVLEQSVAEGADLVDGMAVSLVVSGAQVIEMPELVGSNRQEAEALLAGFETVDIVEQDSALPPGTVLDQTPDAGEEVSPTEPVLLVVAGETPTPDFSQMTVTQATDLLENLGGELTTVYEYQPEGTTGDYVAQAPAAGEPLTPLVTLTLVEGPGVILLEDMEPLQMTRGWFDVEFGQGDINGNRYIHSLVVVDGSNSLGDGLAEYNLGRDFDRLRATAGYDDNALATGEMRLEILGDGTLLFSNDYQLGEEEELLIDVTGVLRLEIRVTTLCCEDGDLDERMLLGQVELLGPESVVAEYRNTEDG